MRNVGSVALCWVQALGTMAIALWFNNPIAWLVAFVLMGPVYARFAILGHEAAHKLLFSDKTANDWVGTWLGAYPSWTPLALYRRSHFAHHREEFGPEEPDMNLYEGYPVTRASMARKLWRDARGTSGWKNLRGLHRALGSETARPIALRIFATQAVLAVAFTAYGVALAGWWGLLTYPVLWFAPWMTVWRVINRLRAVAEHGGMTRSTDRRETTHHIDQHLLARFFLVPFNTGYHLAHHVDMGVPWRNLPKLHAELLAAGWVTPDITYPDYRTLWRELSRREATVAT